MNLAGGEDARDELSVALHTALFEARAMRQSFKSMK